MISHDFSISSGYFLAISKALPRRGARDIDVKEEGQCGTGASVTKSSSCNIFFGPKYQKHRYQLQLITPCSILMISPCIICITEIPLIDVSEVWEKTHFWCTKKTVMIWKYLVKGVDCVTPNPKCHSMVLRLVFERISQFMDCENSQPNIASSVIPYGGFLKWGYPQIIHVDRIFHERNHPARTGTPIKLGTPWPQSSTEVRGAEHCSLKAAGPLSTEWGYGPHLWWWPTRMDCSW